ncbi:MAG: redoxin family protein [Verrucomicrobiota bacterium JB023]|nr:redoxin family protein [Verrucomicrobiota bacterium JB023]
MRTLALAAFAAVASLATPILAKEAPAFTLKDLDGKEHSLADFKGKTVVLEWVNFGCPFVKKHYHKSGNMPELQETYTEKDVVWLSIATGKTAESISSSEAEKAGSKATAILLDPSGETGKAYDAKTTPHMIIITEEGEIAYDGAIDSNSSSKAEDIDSADKYFADALDAVLEGEEVATAKTKPYGCSVKY